MRDAAEIIAGIAAYAAEQREILDAIEKIGGSLHECVFDEEFGRWQHDPFSFIPFAATDETYILNGPTRWDRMLHLLYLMRAAGLVKAVAGTDGSVIYSATPKEKP